jgi:iron complex transport system substrate-binding protein
MDSTKTIDETTGEIVDAAYKLHTGLGPGLLESVYEAVLARDLTRRGLTVERQSPVSFEYDGMLFEDGLRIDLLVNRTVAIELTSVEQIAPVHKKQLLTYLRLLDVRAGLLINFGAPTLKEGLQRIVNKYDPPGAIGLSASPRLRISA